VLWTFKPERDRPHGEDRATARQLRVRHVGPQQRLALLKNVLDRFRQPR
jgi:hypothetical protein